MRTSPTRLFIGVIGPNALPTSWARSMSRGHCATPSRTPRWRTPTFSAAPGGRAKPRRPAYLAMALNCEAPVAGEPDGTCASCVSIRSGSSMDVFELDAASNRKLDEMRDLLSRVALGSPGRWKVYIVDEVHQLTPDAASALLKTLEEPPRHVVFVLATTDPQKVLPTILSRTQHFEFRLLDGEPLTELLDDHQPGRRVSACPLTRSASLSGGDGARPVTPSRRWSSWRRRAEAKTTPALFLSWSTLWPNTTLAGHCKPSRAGSQPAKTPAGWGTTCWSTCATLSLLFRRPRSSCCRASPWTSWPRPHAR